MVEAWEKKAVWGVMMMLGAERRGWSSGGGAGSTTSRPAPARWPEFRASARACSWMIPPRAQLTIIEPGIMLFSSSGPIMPSVSGVKGVCTVMKCERFRTSSKLMISTLLSSIGMVWPGSINGSNATIFMPNPTAFVAIERPYASESEDSEGGAAGSVHWLIKDYIVPSALFDLGVVGDEAAVQGEDHSDGVVGDFVHAVVGDVGDDDA